MRYFHLCCTTLLSIASLGQAKEINLVINNIVPVDGISLPDSLTIGHTNPGPFDFGQKVKYELRRGIIHPSLSAVIKIPNDSCSIRLYFNQSDYVQISGINKLRNDSLVIPSFNYYPDCEQSASWYRITTYDSNAAGDRDPLNFETQVKRTTSTVNAECSVPSTISLLLNDTSYEAEVVIETRSMATTTGHGITRRKWLVGKRKEFNFKEAELNVFRVAEIAIVN